MRKILLLLLFFAGCALILSPLYTANSPLSRAIFSRPHPSNQPLPDAWQSSDPFRVSDPSVAAETDNPVTSNIKCADLYTLQPGDTLGDIAQSCGVTLADLLSANPQIQDPNSVYAGEKVNIPDPLAGRGGVADTGQVQPTSFLPGATVHIVVNGLPANRAARIGLGVSVSGYRLLEQKSTDAGGKIDLTVTLPLDIQPGETAFIMVTVPGLPTVQRMSESFVIGTP